MADEVNIAKLTDEDLAAQIVALNNDRDGLGEQLRILNAERNSRAVKAAVASKVAGMSAPERAQMKMALDMPSENQMVPEEVAAAREKWIDELKAEVGKEAESIPKDKPDWSQRVAQKVIERCWREYGERKEMKGKLNKVASSEALADPAAAAYKRCSELLGDQAYIGNMIGGERATIDELRAIASKSEQRLGPERFKKVWFLIDDAEKSLKKEGGIQAWFDAYWHACIGAT